MALDPASIARDWVNAFNSHDLARIMAHYRVDVVLTSPVYLQVSKGKTATVQGKAAVEAYFTRGLAAYPDLHFTLHEIFEGNGSVCVRYHTTVGDRMACECMEFDPSGLVHRVLAHYAR